MMYTDYDSASDCTNAPAPQTKRDELARLRAIEQAAREFQQLAIRHPAMLLPASRKYLSETLFALLGQKAVGKQ